MSHLSHRLAIVCTLLLLTALPAAAQQAAQEVEPGRSGVLGSPVERPVERRLVEDTAATAATAADSALLEATSAAPDEDTVMAAVPFGPGERASYQVRVGILGGVGNGTMEVVGVEDVRGHPSYNLRLTIKGGVPFYRVDTRLESWLDAVKLVSRRFEQDQKEGKYKRHRIFEFFPEEQRWERVNTDEAGELPTELPLDDVSFLYFVRTLPLEVGQTYTFPRYFKEDGNPVILKVLRKETVSVPVGTFETIVVQPIIKTSGLFGDGGRAEVYFTDDDQRILVQMKSRVPVLKSLNLVLESYVPGKQVAGAGASGDAVAGGDAAGGDAVGDAATGGDAAGDDRTGDDTGGTGAAGVDAAGDDSAGDDTAGIGAAGGGE